MNYKCRLKVILAENDIAIGEFAKRVGVSFATMSAIVNSKTFPSFDVTYRICEEIQLGINEIWIKL